MGTGIHGSGTIPLSRWGMVSLGPPPLDFAAGTFTPSMAKRATSVFAASPIVQGNRDGTGTPDNLIATRGTLIGNPTGYAYTNLDPYQGSIAFWITPEWNGNDGLFHYVLRCEPVTIYKETGNTLTLVVAGQYMYVSTAAWTAGTRYFVVARWDAKNTLDGTNYFCVSVNDVHAFGDTTAPVLTAPESVLNIGKRLAERSADAIIEGLTIYRRPLFDGTYGKDVGNGDEIALMHAAAAGADPCLITGSWDVCFCLPTNATAGALVTGTGEAWSHPHDSMVLTKSMFSDGGYLGGAYAVGYNGTTTSGNAGSGATLDDIPAGGNDILVEVWVRCDSAATYVPIIQKYGANQGWYLTTGVGRPLLSIQLGTTDVVAIGPATPTILDGKWHHIALYYNDATQTGQVATDGIWGTANTGAGAYQSDAAQPLQIGYSGAVLAGALGWFRIHNHQHYTPGTDFIPPRAFPGADAGTVECWAMATGTGNTAVASVTTPANDCVLANQTWERTWNLQGTPVVPTSLEFDGAATYVNCGSGVTLDDLPAGAGGFTAEAWCRPDSLGEGLGGRVLSKGTYSTNGWSIRVVSNTFSAFLMEGAGPAMRTAATPSGFIDQRWHHVAVTYSDTGDRKLRIYLDGVLGGTSLAAVGAYVSDAADALAIGASSAFGSSWDGNIGWTRLSNTVRYTATFVPPARTNPPAPDANTVEQWNFTAGAGLTVPALVTTPANDGVITMGAGRWWNAPGMEWDNPGGRVYNWGYDLGGDAADEGVIQTLTGLTAGANYVARIPVNPGADSQGQAEIVVYDETNGASIVTFLGPRYTGLHTGADNSATLIASAGNFPQSLVGAKLYNITDGSSTTITAISGDKTTITGVLAGGTDNNWDTNDVYRILWTDGYPNHPWCETFTWELPTNARNGVASDCVSMSIRLLNALDVGTLYWHQAEVL